MNVFSALLRKNGLLRRSLRRLSPDYEESLWRFIGFFKKTIVLDTEQGKYRVSCSDDGIGRLLFRDGNFGFDFVSAAAEFLDEKKIAPYSKDCTVLDIGANIGTTAIGLLSGGYVEAAIAIEPEAKNYELLKHNIRINGFAERVHLIHSAVGNSSNDIRLELSPNNLGDHRVRVAEEVSNLPEKDNESSRSVVTVPCDTLSNLLLNVPEKLRDSIGLVWVDVQGYEEFVFSGSEEFFKTGPPVVAELWPYGMKRAQSDVDSYCALTSRLWSYFCLKQNEGFAVCPIANLRALIQGLGDKGNHCDVIFLH